ncbi:MAG: Ni/Fe hydrogenase subunit alpha [Deltaproteobacteria bacterium]|nr:Ni/Fe hydrogenase subunit alpha [Deltaproteobacteria bacterium]
MSGKRRTIKVDYLTRVEGEGGLTVRLRDGHVESVQLAIFEPLRFFAALLRGRAYGDASDITARICGICPVAHQMSAVHAVEDAFGVVVDGPLRALRRLLYCGEWIESHALHIHLLHAPDFLGFPDGVTMARAQDDAVRRGLEIQKAGNAPLRLLGGREIHPINVRVGGFYKLPDRRELARVGDDLRRARDGAVATVRWVAGFDFPELEHDCEFVALRHADEYPFNEGRIVSSRGLDVSAREYDAHFVEEHVAHSTALHARRADGGTYLVGPLARWALNADRISPLARAAARDAGLPDVCRNPFRSVIVRAVELVFACDEALAIIDAYEPPPRPTVPVTPRRATGYAATEAPRGLLYHRYAIDADGTIRDACIVPPTSQNQRTIEEDLERLLPTALALPRPELVGRCEHAIRNHDPCISCATHFLTLRVEGE